MSYSLKLWDNETTDSGFTLIPASDIISLNIDPNRASNDDPFEIVGRTAKVSIMRIEPYIYLFQNLISWSIPLETESVNYTTTTDYFRHLVQVIDDSTGAPIFTGVIKKDLIEYSVRQDTIDVTVCDSLYFWISLAKKSVYRSAFEDESFAAPNGTELLFRLPFSGIAPITTNCPLLGISFDTNTSPGNPQTVNVDLPFGNPPTVTEGYVILGALQLNQIDALDWGLMSENAAVFSVGSGTNPNIAINYFRIYKNRYGNSYKCYYYRSVLVWDDGYYPNAGTNGLINATSLSSLESQMVTNYVMPSSFVRSQTSGTLYLWNGLGDFTVPLSGQTITSYVNDLEYDTGSSTITLNSPAYMQTQMSYLIRPNRYRISSIKSKKISDIAKGICALYSLTMTSAATGGVSVVNHLIGATPPSSSLTISDDDLIDFDARSVIANENNYKNSFSIFAYGDFLSSVQSKQIADFLGLAAVNYQIEIPRTVYEANEWMPFKAITVRGITMYVYKWSEPTLEDTVTIEAFGGWI